MKLNKRLFFERDKGKEKEIGKTEKPTDDPLEQVSSGAENTEEDDNHKEGRVLTALEEAKERVKKKKHTIVQLTGTKIKVLFPDGYYKLKQKNVFKNAVKNIVKDELAFQKIVGSSNNIVTIFKTVPDKAMNPEDVQGLIDDIHECLSEDQGIIEVRNGETKRGYRYIYSIVKNLPQDQFGVRYYLRLNLFHEKDIVEIRADFTEIGMTGLREAACVDLARRAGITDVFEDGYKEWVKDPYDPEYTKGCLKNLAEKEGLDCLFPENPLSQAHEFLLAVLKDEFVTVRQESVDDAESESPLDQKESGNAEDKEGREESEKEFLQNVFVDECRRYTYLVEVEKQRKQNPEKIEDKNTKVIEEKQRWFGIDAVECDEGLCEEKTRIIDEAAKLGLESGRIIAQGCVNEYVYCTESEAEKLVEVLGKDSYVVREPDKKLIRYIKKHPQSKKKTQKEKADFGIKNPEEKKVQKNLDDQLRSAIAGYNAVYAAFNDHGMQLFNQRERAIDLLENIENLINSIANHPKDFDSDIAEIQIKKKEFKDVCDFAREELEAAQRSAAGVGAGIAGGAAIASLAPSAAMWIATTFGTASTGTAISTLSGAAATNAALAWIGGGTIALGGGGIAAGQALLALAGPIGWGLAGASLLTSIVLFANKKMKLGKEKKKEIDSVLRNAEQLRETNAKLSALLQRTDDVRERLSSQYIQAMALFGKDFKTLSEDKQMLLGTIVNNAKALAVSLGEGV